MSNWEACKAGSYMRTYRKQIKNRFLSKKIEKEELFKALDKKNELTGDKEIEINGQYRDDMKKFVNELKSDEKFEMYREQYHQNTKKIRDLLNTIHPKEKLSEGHRGALMARDFPVAKEKMFGQNPYDRDDFVNSFGKSMAKLKKEEKQAVFSSLAKMFSSKENIQKAFKEIKNGISAMSGVDKVANTVFILISLGLVGIGLNRAGMDSILIKILGAGRIYAGGKNLEGILKQGFIDNPAKKETDDALEPFQAPSLEIE